MFSSKLELFDDLSADEEIHSIEEVNRILNRHDSRVLSTVGLRFDLITSAFRSGSKVYFIERFPLAKLSERRQGWTSQGVLDLVNSLLSHFGIQGISDLGKFNKQVLSEEVLAGIETHIPPIIVSSLPDGIFHLDDGNHRVALADFFQLKYIRCFLIV